MPISKKDLIKNQDIQKNCLVFLISQNDNIMIAKKTERVFYHHETNLMDKKFYNDNNPNL